MTHQRRLQEDRICYGVAILCVTLALGITLLLSLWLYFTTTPRFFLAEIASAWAGGLGSRLLVSILSTLAIDYFSIEPLYSLHFANLETILWLSMFLSVAVSLGWFERSQQAAIENAKVNFQSLQATDEAELQTQRLLLETVVNCLPSSVASVDGRDLTFQFVSHIAKPIESSYVMSVSSVVRTARGNIE